MIWDLNNWRLGGEGETLAADDSRILTPWEWMNNRIELFRAFQAGQHIGTILATPLLVFPGNINIGQTVTNAWQWATGRSYEVRA